MKEEKNTNSDLNFDLCELNFIRTQETILTLKYRKWTWINNKYGQDQVHRVLSNLPGIVTMGTFEGSVRNGDCW